MRFDDDVADVNADTKNQAPIFGIINCKLANIVLKMHGSPNGLDRARELGQKPVARA